jgi:hypothetical protein
VGHAPWGHAPWGHAPWGCRRLARPAGVLAWTGSTLLLLRGGAGIVDDLTRATGILPNGLTGLTVTETTGTTSAYAVWSGRAIDAYFLIGGIIFTWLALRHRQFRHTRRLTRPEGAESG